MSNSEDKKVTSDKSSVGQETQDKSPFNDLVFDKYKHSASISNAVLKMLVEKCIPGASVRQLCEFGDEEITKKSRSLYKQQKDMKKGVAFPTCISLNNCLCHFSPLSTDPEVTIKKGDLAKIDLSVHVDGYISSVGTTLVVGATKEEPVTSRTSEVLMSAYSALQYGIRMFTPGTTNHQVTEAVNKVVKEYHCCCVEGMLSHQMTHEEMFSTKVVMLNPTDAMKKEYKVTEFQPYEVYALEVFVSTSSEGKCQERDAKATVFRRNPSTNYDLRSKVARETLRTVNANTPKMAFHLRTHPNINRARLGLKECIDHQLISSYPVYYDREKEMVAQLKCTLIVTSEGPLVLTMPIFDLDKVQCEIKLQDPEILKLLSTPLSVKKVRNKKPQNSDSTKSKKVPADDPDKSDAKSV